jgi:hypothetical protein
MQKRQFGEGEKLVSARIAGGDSGVQLGQCSLWIRLEALRQIPTIENDSAGIAFLADSQHIGGEFAMNNARMTLSTVTGAVQATSNNSRENPGPSRGLHLVIAGPALTSRRAVRAAQAARPVRQPRTGKT